MTKQEDKVQNPTATQATIEEHLKKLSTYMTTARCAKMSDDNIFNACLFASLSRAYDYSLFTHQPSASEGAPFIIATLRSICEDVIILGLVHTFSARDRNDLVRNLVQLAVINNATTQAVFFRTERPHQSTIALRGEQTDNLKQLETTIREIWRRNGWNLTRDTMPQTRQIAAKQGPAVLSSLYDFLFRFTSGGVHFNPQMLLRSGWGDPKIGFTFKASNFDQYYLSVAQTYSCFLLCVYFELFWETLALGLDETNAIRGLRSCLRMQERWPEMVTHEELNVPSPKFQIMAFVARYLDAENDRPFLGQQPHMPDPV